MEKGKQIDIGNSSRHYGSSRAKSKNMSIDCSRVRIMSCDHDTESCEEVCTLLTKCSYQVGLPECKHENVEVHNAGSPFPAYFSVLSMQDESRFLYNFVKFGATDYLVKPLCIDEILNLWIHSWRQRKPHKGLEPPRKSISLCGFSRSNYEQHILVFDDTITDEEFPEDP